MCCKLTPIDCAHPLFIFQAIANIRISRAAKQQISLAINLNAGSTACPRKNGTAHVQITAPPVQVEAEDTPRIPVAAEVEEEAPVEDEEIIAAAEAVAEAPRMPSHFQNPR